jgi:hypothetical protein
MLFAIALLFAGAFSVLCGKALRKHPVPFYLTAAILSIVTAILANTQVSMPAFLQQNIIIALYQYEEVCNYACVFCSSHVHFAGCH